MYTAKFETFCLINFFKKKVVFSFIKLVWWKTVNQNLKLPHEKKIKYYFKNKTTNEWTWNVLAASFSLGALAPFIYAVYFVK